MMTICFWSFSAQFDEALRETFELYSQLRAVGSIDSMRVRQVARGSFHQLRRLMTSRSSSSSSSEAKAESAAEAETEGAVKYNPQYKVPRVVRDREFLDLLITASLN